MKKGKFNINDTLLAKVPLADHRCAICLNQKNLSVHHIRKRSNGGNNNLDNLMVLCRLHHDMIDGHKKCEDWVLDIYDLLYSIKNIERQVESLVYQKSKLKKAIIKIRDEQQDE